MIFCGYTTLCLGWFGFVNTPPVGDGALALIESRYGYGHMFCDGNDRDAERRECCLLRVVIFNNKMC